MKIITITIALFLICGAITADPKDNKKKEQSNLITTTDGIIYSLPQTGIRVKIDASRERVVSGPYSIYAKKMLGIDNAPTENYDFWKINKIEIEIFNEPDPENTYKSSGAIAQLINLSENGVIEAINNDIKLKNQEIETQNFLTKEDEKKISFTDLSIRSFYSPLDAGGGNRLISKSTEQKAAEAAETIFNLRNSRFNLLTNADDEPLPDGKSFEIMAIELGKTEENYLSLFIGKRDKQEFKYSFDYVPGAKTVIGEVFFRFSKERGVLPKSDLSGQPITIDVIKSDLLSEKQSYLNTTINQIPEKRGMYYRLPGQADIRLMDGINQLAGTRIPLAQFGNVVPIPENLLNGSYKIEFHNNTGAIKSINKTDVK